MGLSSFVRDVVFDVLDARDRLLRLSDPLTPPRKLMNVGTNSIFRSDFNKIGTELFANLVNIGGLLPNHRVLDVGCGIGRMAIPLTKYLTSAYDGFDIVKKSIDYCTDNISSKYSNFRFLHVDLSNSNYAPQASSRSEDFVFPYDDNRFDFVILTSVFTHMNYIEVKNYLKEINRVLDVHGLCFATYFLLNKFSESCIESGLSKLRFSHEVECGRAEFVDNPGAAIAFYEETILGLYREIGFALDGPVRYGDWCGRKSESGFQDILLAKKLPL